jgi:tetratricopeptide (TPR) repeat protein
VLLGCHAARGRLRLVPLFFLLSLSLLPQRGLAFFQRRLGQQYSAKIALEGDIPLPNTPLITIGGQTLLQSLCRVDQVFGNGTVVYEVRFRPDYGDSDSCEVTIELSGYRKTQATLHDKAVIVLKRIGDHEGSSVSAISIQAPKEAKKAFEKGAAELSKQKWASAQKDLENAVSIYPAYAQAWADLAEALSQQGKAQEARDALAHALKADPSYLKPYVQMARLDLSESRYEDALAVTSAALKLNPVEFPAIYFYDAIANVNLKQFDDAEKSARRAVELDSDHEFPRAEHLLAALLAGKGDNKGALEHYEKYLQLSPQANDAPEVKARIQALQNTGGQQK